MIELRTMEMHTGGEPVRIVTSGYPEIPGPDVLAKRRYAREHLDHLRRLLIYEPRGHADMYGAVPVTPSSEDADLAVLFMHNQGYSTMCGHAVIALGRYAVDHGLVRATQPHTRMTIECPCGLVAARVDVKNGVAGRVTFDSVPAFAYALDATVDTASFGRVAVDIGYGGAFYAIVPAQRIGLDVREAGVDELAAAAREVSAATAAQYPLTHPQAADLGFLYGTIVTDGRDAYESQPTVNVCVFAGSQVDRSPTGSGVAARMAVQHRKGQVACGQARRFESLTGARFTGEVVSETRCGAHPAVVVSVSGRAHYCGEARYYHEAGDRIGQGFLLGRPRPPDPGS